MGWWRVGGGGWVVEGDWWVVEGARYVTGVLTGRDILLRMPLISANKLLEFNRVCPAWL